MKEHSTTYLKNKIALNSSCELPALPIAMAVLSDSLRGAQQCFAVSALLALLCFPLLSPDVVSVVSQGFVVD